MESKIFKDYTEKIGPKIQSTYNMDEYDFNNMLNLLNWCFVKKNNFFIPNFNTKFIINICNLYNQLKTNILSKTSNNLFESTKFEDLKTLKFILHNYINNFNTINTQVNTELCNNISAESIKNCVLTITQYLNSLEK